MKSFLCRLLLASFVAGVIAFCNPRPSINDFLSVTPKKTIDDFLLYGLAWLIIVVGHFFWYFIWCGFQSKKDFVFDIILFSLFYIIGILCLWKCIIVDYTGTHKTVSLAEIFIPLTLKEGKITARSFKLKLSLMYLSLSMIPREI